MSGMSTPLEDAALPPEEQRKVTLYRLILSIYVRCEAAHEGRSAEAVRPEDVIAFAERWGAAIEHDLRLFSAVMEEARRAGIGDANNALRRIDSADPRDIDSAIEWAANQARAEREGRDE